MQHPFGSISWGGVGDVAMGDSGLGVILGGQEGLGYVPAGMKAKMGLTIVQCEHSGLSWAQWICTGALHARLQLRGHEFKSPATHMC